MKLYKPNWISHDGQPIFSIDIHPDGSRFATGGQGVGGSSGKVIIWNMIPVRNRDDEVNDDVPKVLCVMENHLACVNSVRWSCNGRYLASGGDDKLIMIWQFAGYGSTGAFGGSSTLKTTTGERWRCTHTLKYHTGDVLDLAWSPADQWLASCSIDNTVVVWSVKKFPEITAVLKGHTSFVKGVTWDPIGSYVASQSDDKTVKIWKTLDWKLEMTIDKPFTECTATTHVLRLSWSPDGGYLVSAHAMNNSGPTAQIIERAGWRTEMDFVGHRKAITCTRFNGCVFSKTKSKDRTSLPYTCCAVGSRDRSLSVWLTSLRRPLVVVHDLFDNSIMDLSWSFDGYSLLCCSWDGSVAFVEFTPDEIGQTLTQEEKNKLHKETYGKTSDAVTQPLIIENPAMLAIQEKKVDQSINNSVMKATTAPVKYPTEQIETRTPTGRRRIIPVFVAPQEALGGIPRPFGSSSAFSKTSANLVKSTEKVRVDAKADVSPAKEVNESRNSLKSSINESLPPISSKDESKEKEQVTKITEERSSPNKEDTDHHSRDKGVKVDEMKKKAVLDIRLSEKTKTSAITKPSTISKSSTKPTSSTPNVAGGTSMIPQSSPRKPGRPPLHLKRKQMNEISPVKRKQVRKDHTKSLTSDVVTQHVAPSGVETTTSPPKQTTSLAVIDNLLPSRKLSPKISVQSTSSPHLTMIAENEVTSDEKITPCALHKVVCLRNKQEQWSTVMSSPITILHCSKSIVGVACFDHTIHVLSLASGRRLYPPICCGSSTSSLSNIYCRGHHLMAIDTSCRVSVWNTKKGKVVVDARTFSHLLPTTHRQQRAANFDSSPLRKYSLTQSGLPLITLIDSQSYVFSLDLASWLVASSPNDSLERFSEEVVVATTTEDHMTKHENEIMTSMRKRLSSGNGAHASRAFHATPSTQRNATLAMLEHKVAACITLQSVSEYRKWLLAYVRYLVQEDLKLRLREVCDDLIGPPSQRQIRRTNQTEAWSSHVLGIRKRFLLRDDILPIIGSNLSFQRFYTEYHDQLLDVDHHPWRID